jgi:hypothetical protein
MGLENSKWCDPANLLALRICFLDDSPPPGMGEPDDDEIAEFRVAPDVDLYLNKGNADLEPQRTSVMSQSRVTEVVAL